MHCDTWIANLGKDHGRDFLRGEYLGLTEVVDLDHWVAALVDDLEGPGLDILLDGGIVEAATDQSPSTIINSIALAHMICSHSLDIEDGVLWVHSSLVLSRLTDQSLF